ncbi:hypothetical protein [Nocardioides stalactiti]|uniref:hypothetical protein n=1 Tax=Nocardioides stalactiti TaxID=2755356 RepID=UPI001C7F05D3|nr:hypothetical protein [Nocardioides stalactiti]
MPRRSLLALLALVLAAITCLASAPAAVAVDRDCGDFPSQRAAQIFFLNHGGPRSDPHGLDSEGDGIACESNPAPYYYGTSLPGDGGQDPQPQPTPVSSSVDLALEPDQRIAGESFRIKVTVKPAISRKVLVQRKVDGRWKSFDSLTTGENGSMSATHEAPRARTIYRAVVQSVTKAGKKYSAATSKSRTLEIQRQRVVLTFDDADVADGEQVRARVHATPVRPGRPVALQKRVEGTWTTIRTGSFNRRGSASFAVTAALGKNAYRAVALRHRGASPEQSDTETVTANDVTAPPTPYDLVAVAGDGAVQLSWSRMVPADLDHHEVWMRTDAIDWALVTVTTSDNAEITSLQNDVTYWFAVTSVDQAGNTSEPSEEVSATPTAPAPRQARLDGALIPQA